MHRHTLWVALLSACAGGAPEGAIRLDHADASVEADGSRTCALGECRLVGAGICGDGYLEPGPAPAREACDDGNTSAGDACGGGCTPTVFTVSERAGARDMSPVVAEDDAGHALIGWIAEDAAAGQRVVRVRAYSSAGVAAGSAVNIATIPGLGDDATLVMAPLATGFVLAWGGSGVDDTEGGIRLARIAASGTLSGSIIVPMTVEERRGAQHSPSLAVIRDRGSVSGVIALGWIDESLPSPIGRGGRAMLRRLPELVAEASLEPSLVLSDPGRASRQISLAANRRGALLALWQEADESGGDAMLVRGQRFTGTTSLDAAPITVLGDAPAAFTAAALRDHAFVLAAAFRTLEGAHGLVGRLDETTLAPAWAGEATLGTAERPAITGVVSGEWIAGWQSRAPASGMTLTASSSALSEWLDGLAPVLAGTNASSPSLARGAQGAWVTWTDASSVSRRRVRAFLVPFEDACRDCGAATPICDEPTATCVACRGDYDCNAAHPYCDASGAAGCVECLSDAHCAGLSSATAGVCQAGSCSLTCAVRRGDCDDIGSNGCEVDLRATTNCGACGVVCASGQTCSAGACAWPSITTDLSSYVSGAPIVLSWSGLPGTTTDSVRIYRVVDSFEGPVFGSSTPNLTPGMWQLGRQPVGSMTVSRRLGPGTYEARAYVGATVLVARSTPFTVTGPETTVSTTRRVIPVTHWGNVHVTWENLPDSPRVLVLAVPGSPRGSFIESLGSPWPLTGRDVSVPTPGRYVIRLLEGSRYYGFYQLAESPMFIVGVEIASVEPTYTAGSAVSVLWYNFNLYLGTSPAADDWVDVAEPGWASDRYWARSSTALESEHLFPIRLPPGTYVMRSHRRGQLRVSEPFTVTGALDVSVDSPETVPASVPFQVSFAGFFGAATDWIGVAAVGSPDTTTLYHVDTGGGESGTVTLPALPDGDYEVRGYFSFATTQSYRVVARDQVHVGPWDQ